MAGWRVRGDNFWVTSEDCRVVKIGPYSGVAVIKDSGEWVKCKECSRPHGALFGERFVANVFSRF